MAQSILFGLLLYAIATMWVGERWAWSVFQVGIFALAGFRASKRARLPFPLACSALSAAAAWPLLQLATGRTLCRAATWDAALNWFTFLVVFALTADLAQGAGRRGLSALAICGMVWAAIATAQNYSSGGKVFWMWPSGYSVDVLGPFVNRNQYSAWIELLLPIAVYLAVTSRRKPILYGCAAAMMFGSVVASASRTGFAIASVEIVIVLALASSARRATFILVGVSALALPGWQGLQTRLESGISEALRLDAARASIQMIRERPLTGSGLGTWATLYPRYAAFDTGMVVNQAHNDWLQWAAEGGIPFALFLIFFAALLWKPAIRSIFGIGTLAFLLHAAVDYPMQQRPALAAWFFAIAAVTFVRGSCETGHGLLRRVRSRSDRGGRRHPESVSTVDAALASRSVRG